MAVEIKEVQNRKAWDRVLDQFDYSTMFLAWEWAEFERSLGNDFRTFVVFADEKPVALIPLKFIKAKRGRYVHVRHGPLLDWEDKQLAGQTLSFVKGLAKKEGMHFIRMSPLVKSSEETRKFFAKQKFRDSVIHATDAELTVTIDLTKSEKEILMSARKNTRNLVRKAEKLGIKVKHVDNVSLFDDFEKLYLDTISRQKWTAYPISYVKKELEMFMDAGKARMFVSYYENEPVSAAIFIEHGNQAIYHFSGSSSKHRKLPATYLLHWEAIKHYKKAGLKLYNMWGVSPKDKKGHPWYGLSLFKRGFTNNELEFVHSQDCDLHWFAKLTHLFEYIETKRRGY